MTHVNFFGQSSIELLARLQAGDTDAQDALLARYLPRLQRWASGRLSRGLRTMRETGDLVQEVLIAALPHLPSLEIRTEAALQDYLRRAVRNRIIDLHRRSGRRPVRQTMPDADAVVAQDASPLERAIGVEALERYERALDRLSPDDRQTVFLRVEFDLDWAELAEQTGKPTPDAARMAFKRAVRRLAGEMSDEPV